MILIQALLALSTHFSAHADPATMAAFVGTYSVQDCAFTENYMANPKDYYCRATSVTVSALDANNAYTISFVDELGQNQHDIAMSEFKETQKDGTIVEGTFTNADNSSTFALSQTNPDNSSLRQSRAFSVDPTTGLVTLDRTLSASNTDSYKSAEWIFKLVRKKN